MFAIYRTTWTFAKSNIAAIVFFAVILTGLDIFAEVTEKGSTSTTVGWAVILYTFHRAVMFGMPSIFRKNHSPVRPERMGRFILVVLAIVFVPLGVSLAITALLVPRSGGFDRDFFMVVLLPVFFALYGLTLTLFGTAMPAAAAADRFGLGITLQRAKRTWKMVLGGTLVGPALFVVLSLALLLALPVIGIPIGTIMTADGAVDPLQLLIGFLIRVSSVFGALLGVTVLCRAYKKVAPEEIIDVLSGPLAEVK